MKNLFKSLMLVAVAAMAFTACQTDADIDQSGIGKVKGTTITVSAGFNEETRAYLVDGDGEFLVRWDREDSVIFQATATDGTTTYAHATEPTLINDGESAEFTATFPKEIKTGTVKAYIRGYYYYSYESYYDYWSGTYVEYHNFYPQGLNYQYPEQDAPGYIVASAEFEYNGEELISEPVTFNHEFGYGKVTIKEDVEAHSMTLKFNDGNYTYRLENLSNIEGNTFWFVADPMKVSTMDITLNTMDGRTMIKSVDMSKVENPLDFEAGKVSTFALQNFGVKLEQPYGTATVSEGSIVFDWNDVENATSYDIVLTKEYSEVIYSGSVTASEYAATGLENSTYYSLSIVAKADGYVDSDVCELDGTTPATRADLDAWKNDEVTFTYMRQLTAENDNIYLSNAYLFSTREITGKPTQDDTFMYLAFNNDVDFTQNGVYDIYDLSYSWCYIWLPNNIVDGWYGYTDNYSLGWNPYHFYPNSGDTYQVYVDFVDGETTITVYASCNWWSNIHFKGTWSSANTPEQPSEPSEPEEPETPSELVYTSAALAKQYNYNDVMVQFSGADGEDLYINFYGVAMADNILQPGTYTIGNGLYTGYCYYGDYVLNTCTVDVSFANGEYNIVFTNMTSGSLTLPKSITYNGTITDLGIPDMREKLESPNATTAVSGNMITISWNPITGADEYYVFCYVGGLEAVTTTDTSVTIEAAYGTKYDFLIRAVAHDSNPDYKNSEDYYFSVTTEEDPNVGGDDDSGDNEGAIVLSSCTYKGNYEGLLQHYQLASSDGSHVINILFHQDYAMYGVIATGTFNSDSAYNTYLSNGSKVCVNGLKHTINGVENSSANQTGSKVVVSKSGTTYTVTIELSTVSHGTLNYTFEGALS